MGENINVKQLSTFLSVEDGHTWKCMQKC